MIFPLECRNDAKRDLTRDTVVSNHGAVTDRFTKLAFAMGAGAAVGLGSGFLGGDSLGGIIAGGAVGLRAPTAAIVAADVLSNSSESMLSRVGLAAGFGLTFGLLGAGVGGLGGVMTAMGGNALNIGPMGNALTGAVIAGMVTKMRSGVADTWDETGEYGPGQIAKMLETDESGEPKIYNIVMTGHGKENRIAIGRVDGGDKLPDWVLTKHLMLSNYDPDVRFAGETWAEPFLNKEGKQGIRVHLNGNSGTYKPSDEQTKAAGKYLTSIFSGVEGVEVVTHNRAETNLMAAMRKAKKKVDHERRFALTDDQFEKAKSLDGQTIKLKGVDGKSKSYKIRHFKQVELETDYLDTPQGTLLDAQGMLRARTRYKKPGEEQVKDIEIEAKLPIPDSDDPSKRARIKGAEFESAEAWQAAKQDILSPQSSDPAVEVTRTALAKGEALSKVAQKTTVRDLFLVSPSVPLVGALAPAFVISLDSISASSADGTDQAEWKRIEPQVFTKLPWTKKVDENRLARFGDLVAQVSNNLGLTEVKENPYQETMAKLNF